MINIGNNFDIVACGAIYLDKLFKISTQNFNFDNEYIITNEIIKPGGSVINFSIECMKNSISPLIFGCIGNDFNGKKILYFLKKLNIITEYIQITNKSSTGFSVIMQNIDKEHIIFTNIGANQNFIIRDLSVLDNINSKLLYFGGIFKMKNLFYYFDKLIKWAKGKNMLIAIDHGRFFSQVKKKQLEIIKNLLKRSDFYFPDEKELLGLTKTNSLNNATENILRSYPRLNVIIKRGGKGCRVIENRNVYDIPTSYCKDVASTVGAGDKFNAIFIKNYIFDNLSIIESARIANEVTRSKIREKS